MFLSKRIYSIVKNNNLTINNCNNGIKSISCYYSTSGKKAVSSNLKKMMKPKSIKNKSTTNTDSTSIRDASGYKELLSKYTMENLDDENDNPTIDEIDEDEEFQFDSQLKFNDNQDPEYRKQMENSIKGLKEEELERQREKSRKQFEIENEQRLKSYYTDDRAPGQLEDKRSIDEDMRLEFWARQMALRDSLKNDGGRYLLDENAYLEPIKNYKTLGRKLIKQRFDEKKKEVEEKKLLKLKIQQQKRDQLGLTEEQVKQYDENQKESIVKSKETLKQLLSNKEFEQYEREQDNVDDDDEFDGQEFNAEIEQDIGLPNLSRLTPHSSVPAPIEIVQELLEIRKQDLIRKTEEASDEFEKRRRIKRIEFMAKKKELQHRQMLERHQRTGFTDSIIKGDDDLPIEIDPKTFSRFQKGEITEQEMLEISKLENKQDRENIGKEQNNDNEELEENEDNDEEDESIEKIDRNNTKYLKHWKIGSIGIPPKLKKKISSVIKDYPTKQLREDAALLSESLRDRTRLGRSINDVTTVTTIKPDEKPVIVYGKGQAMAYISHRMPGVYSCTHRVFSEINTRLPSFKPTSILDYGSGPGTVLWSTDTIWGDSIKKMKAIEPSTHMTEIAKKLLEGNTNRVKWSPFLNTEQIKRSDGSIPENDQNELVTASYVLSELPNQEARNKLVLELWSHVKPSGLLVLIEPGTPVGFGIIKEVRQLILDQPAESLSLHKSYKAQVVSPCPHSGRCPMSSLSWCHFSQRVERPVFQKLAKGPGSTMPYEDEKYSYIVLSKMVSSSIPNQLEKQNSIYPPTESTPTKQWSRLVEAPLKRGGHIIMDVCSPTGELNRVTIAKSHGRQIYKEARKSFWSDAFILDPQIVDVKESRYNLTEQEEIQQRIEHEKLLKENGKFKSTKPIVSGESKETTKTTTTTGKNKKEKENKDWMNELQGGDRKILEKLIKQGKFSEHSTGLFGQEDDTGAPIMDDQQSTNATGTGKSDYGTPNLALGFMEDVDDFKDEEDEAAAKAKKEKKTVYDLQETSKSRKGRKEKLINDLRQLKKQSMSKEQREEQEAEEQEIRNSRKSYKENNPKKIEYYLKNYDQLEQQDGKPLDQQEIDKRFESRLQSQKEMQDNFINVRGLGVSSKTTRDKLIEKKDQIEKIKQFKKFKEQQKQDNNDNVD